MDANSTQCEWEVRVKLDRAVKQTSLERSSPRNEAAISIQKLAGPWSPYGTFPKAQESREEGHYNTIANYAHPVRDKDDSSNKRSAHHSIDIEMKMGMK